MYSPQFILGCCGRRKIVTYFALYAVFPKKTSYIFPIYSCMLALFLLLLNLVLYSMQYIQCTPTAIRILLLDRAMYVVETDTEHQCQLIVPKAKS